MRGHAFASERAVERRGHIRIRAIQAGVMRHAKSEDFCHGVSLCASVEFQPGLFYHACPFDAFIAGEIRRWQELSRTTGLKLD